MGFHHIKTILSNIEHHLTNRTPYTATARHRTEEKNLDLWHHAGFDVPLILKHQLPKDLPVPCLCMEYLEGQLLTSRLADNDTPQAATDQLFRDFVSQWASRHAAALDSGNPALIQEHATLDHVIVCGHRFVTIDLEVSYTSPKNLPALIANEITGYFRSVFKRMPYQKANHLLDILIDS